MHSRWRRTLRITRRTLSYSALAALVFAALIVSIANLYLPFIENNPSRVQAWLSERVGQPVHYRQAKAEWTRRGPRIELSDLRVGNGDAAVRINRAELLVAVYSGLFPEHPLTELKVKNLRLRLHQQPDGSWKLLGLPQRADASADALDVMAGFGELQLERAQLIVQANKQPAFAIPRLDMRLRVQGEKLSVGMRVQAKIGEAPMVAVAKLNRREYTGAFWLGGKQLALPMWLALLPAHYRPGAEGNAGFDVWGRLERGQLSQLHGRLTLSDVRKPSAKKTTQVFALGRLLTPKDTLYERIDMRWRWQRQAQGWQAQIQDAQFINAKDQHRIDNLRVAYGAEKWQARAQRIDVQAFSRLATVAGGLWPAQALELEKYAPSGQLLGVVASGNRHLKTVHVSGRAKALALNAVGKAPGFSGIGGAFSADERGGSWRFDATPMQLIWPQAFGRRVPSQLQGNVQWWRSGTDWVLAMPNMQWRAEGMGLDINAQMHFRPNTKTPQLYLAARLPDFDFVTAKQFWPRHVMPKASIDWLNMALQKGQVRNGTVLVAGDLADWPFTQNKGRFKATATVQAEKFKFAADWPAADNAILDADFNGPGFTAAGTAQFLGNPISLLPSGIEVFKESQLRVVVNSESALQTLLPVLQQTPLLGKVGPQVSALRGNGAAKVSLDLFFPLKQGAAFNQIRGSVAFDKSQIRSPDWNLAIAQAIGTARFDNAGFSAADVRGIMERTPVTLDVWVGVGHVVDAKQHIQARVRGNFSSDVLLRYHKDLADLKGVIKGTSPWQFDVSVPKLAEQNQAPVFLSAQSNLQGTSIALPAPLAKPAGGLQAFAMRTQLPIDRGTIDIRFGPVLRLLLKKPLNQPMQGIALLGAQNTATLPANGLSVRGETEEFDAPGWLALANKAEGGIGLQVFDITVNRMRLLGQDFGSTRLQILPGLEAMTVKADGARLQGTVNWPKAKAQTVSARFERVHFVAGPKPIASEAPASATAPASPLDLGNPAFLPPLQLRIDDARVGGVLLGRVDLQTQPDKQGLLIQKFSSQSPLLAMTASGVWQGQGGQARTSLQATVNSPDLGKVLASAQLNNVLRRGKTTAKLSGVWDGEPLDFTLAGFKGLLELRIDEGQFPEVKAGGGRFLGLMSLAELPRRLSLNFNDLTDKGLGFNTIKGEFRFAQGVANTRNLRIDAPAADIRITGNTDLINERFDQQVQVQPKAGGLLPVIGAATAGPIGAAAGVVAQAVLNKPIKEGSAIEYRITGPWKQPVVVKQSDDKKK